MILSQRLKTLRQIRGLTQEQLAQLTGIANTYISLIETETIFPGNAWEERIRKALNWTPEIDAKLDELAKEK